MRIKTTYGQLNVGDRFFIDPLSLKGACRIKTTSSKLTHFANGDKLYSPETWRDKDAVWIDNIEEVPSFETHPVGTEEKIKQQAAEIERLRTALDTALEHIMNIDYEGQGGLTAFDVADKALKRKAGE